MTDASAPEGATPPEPLAEEDARRAHDRARLRWPLRLLGFGAALSFGLAFLGSYGAKDGALGALMFFLLLTLFMGLAALLLAGQLLLDEMRGRPTSRRRGVLATGLFIGSFVSIIVVNGVATSVGTG